MNTTSNRSQSSRLLIALAFLPLTTTSVAASLLVTIEPDNYADSQKLNTISPFVVLSTAVPPSNVGTFDVLAYIDAAGASTGTKVFAQGPGVPFWNDTRKLRMDFLAPVSSVSLDYIASGFFDNSYAGRLEAYSTQNVLLASDDTALLTGGQHKTMIVSAPKIAYALAYPPLDPFGDLDHLQFSVVPEPATLLMLATGPLAALTLRRRPKTI
jgi:hypothetical protein